MPVISKRSTISSRLKLNDHRHEAGGVGVFKFQCCRLKLNDHRREAGGVEVFKVRCCRRKLNDHRHEAGGVLEPQSTAKPMFTTAVMSLSIELVSFIPESETSLDPAGVI